MSTSTSNLTEFLIAFAEWLAPLATLNWQTSSGGNLFIYNMPDGDDVPSVAAVINVTSPAPRGWDILDKFRVQIMIRGQAGNTASAMDIGWSVYQAFTDSNNLPKRRLDLSEKWFIHELDPIGPQSSGLDEKKRPLIVVNVDITAGQKLAA